jgi:hypothetical protein
MNILILIYELSTLYKGIHSVECYGAYSSIRIYVGELRSSRHYYLGICVPK